MLVSKRWLSEFCKLPESIDVLVDDLNRIGFEVELIEEKGHELKNIVVGHIQSMDAHPDADRLRIAQVDIGKETIQIVTAAANVNSGDNIPVALPGATLANDLKIKKGKLRGVESNGMMCSAVECGLTDTSPGVWVLPKHTPIGVDFIDYAQLVDTILDIAILPNRGDCLSLYGLARECGALYNKPLTVIPNNEDVGSEETPVTITIDSNVCSFYQAKKISGIAMVDTPVSFQTRLYYCGMRPISWIVDVTNIVMIEYGQPLHAFDAQAITKVSVERSKKQSATLLNEKEYDLDQIPIISVDHQVGAVAGIMGAQGSEVTGHTDAIVLEAAIFDAVAIRKASKQLGLRSESSNRFEKGVDILSLKASVNRVVELLTKFNDQPITSYLAVQQGQNKSDELEIKVDLQEINQFLGTEFSKEAVVQRLVALGFKFENDNIVSVPSWRQRDCKEWPDIAEELFRFHGMEGINASPLQCMIPMSHDLQYTFIQACRNICIHQGLTETVPFPLSEEDEAKGQPVVQNPISPELRVLRSNGIDTILNTVALNAARHSEPCRLFSIGPVWSEEGIESKQLSIAIQGSQHHQPYLTTDQHQKVVDFYDIKGIASYIIKSLGYEFEINKGIKVSQLHPGQSATIMVDGKAIGVLGMIHPHIEQTKKVTATGLIDINLSALKLCTKKDAQYEQLSRFPSTSRDVTYIMNESVDVGSVLNILKDQKPKLCKSIILCGYYQAKHASDVNVSFRMSYQDNHETLDMESVNIIHKDFAESVINKLPCRFPGTE